MVCEKCKTQSTHGVLVDQKFYCNEEECTKEAQQKVEKYLKEKYQTPQVKT